MFGGYIKIVQRDISVIARACRSNALWMLGYTAFYCKMAKMLNVNADARAFRVLGVADI